MIKSTLDKEWSDTIAPSSKTAQSNLSRTQSLDHSVLNQAVRRSVVVYIRMYGALHLLLGMLDRLNSCVKSEVIGHSAFQTSCDREMFEITYLLGFKTNLVDLPGVCISTSLNDNLLLTSPSH